MPCLRILLLFLLLLCSRISASSASTTTTMCSCCSDKKVYSFFPSFGHGSSDDTSELDLFSDARISDGVVHLASGGAVLLRAPVTLGRSSNDSMMPMGMGGSTTQDDDASFETCFTMNVVGGGLAFVVVPNLAGLPPPGSDEGGFFLSPTTGTGSKSNGGFVAVKFETAVKVKQPDDSNGDDDHNSTSQFNIALIVSGYPLSASPPNISIPSSNHNQSTAKNYTVWINYNGAQHYVWVYMDAEGGLQKPEKAVLEAPHNLSDHVPQRAFVGFTSSSTAPSSGAAVGYYSILSWNLTVEELPAGDDGQDMGLDWKVILPAVIGAISVTAIMNMFVAALYFNSRYRALKMELVLSEALRRLPGTPREFKHAAMRKATDNFHEARRLGRGGFGAVYRGTLRSPPGTAAAAASVAVEVAVKKFTRNENRCYDDFLDEVDIINRLRHRNIVPLVGWCYEKGELLLIYEYMPNGSLDQHLFPKQQQQQQQPGLTWSARYGIVVDVAAGLHYIHHEHEHTVLHRDIKTSNVMLDAAFRGRLGDFSLARVVGLDKKYSYTDLAVAGTWGFISPEYSVSHKATRKTDVYAFGVLVLEVVTGRQVLQDAFRLLTDWVWKLHREARLLEAVDAKMASMDQEEFDEDDAMRLLLLGLACTNPNPFDRPSMVEVMQIVARSVPAPEVPVLKPNFVWPPEDGMMPQITEMSDLHGSHSWEQETTSSDALAASAIIRRKGMAWAVSTG